MPVPLKTVLVLSTGNCCRSQMAEAILNRDLAGRVRALSAGTRPQPEVSEHALEALRQVGLPGDGLYPKDVASLLDEPIDLVVTLYYDKAKEGCPIFPRPVPSIHLPFCDPHDQSLAFTVAIRDQIRYRLPPAVVAALGL